MTKSKTVQATFALALAIAGCSKTDQPAAAASQGDEATPSETPIQGENAALNDAQMLQILSTVDTGEIAQAQIAVTKASTPQVRDFASQMIEEHNKAKQKGVLLASQTNITPASSPVSKNLHSKGATTLDKLQSTDPGSFDETYMKAQVKQHQEVLNLLDTQLIPAATNPDVHNHLVTARGMVEMHLTHAKKIQASMPQ
jgi:putative membrane protein